ARFERLRPGQLEGFTLRVVVEGASFPVCGSALQARFGSRAVAGVMIHHDGFIGFLDVEPEEGAHLFIGYDKASRDTGVVYRRQALPVAGESSLEESTRKQIGKKLTAAAVKL